ncbi:gamma subclass chorismate mutase AroQ [Bauldia sp.]|uniref:gamma subclass chorismate mutase AroQ n=1 Tax=Bauldia sp. TaxID=2575872 RepID=UPI003BACA5F4
MTRTLARFVLPLAALLTLVGLAAHASDRTTTLRQVMTDRLVIMIDVARHKWNTGAPIEDLDREAVVLEATTERAVAGGVDPDRAAAMVEAQIAAAKIVQFALFEQWQAANAEPFADAPDLVTELRPEISRLTAALIDAVAATEADLADCTVHATLAPVPSSLADFPNAWATAVAGVTDGGTDCG